MPRYFSEDRDTNSRSVPFDALHCCFESLLGSLRATFSSLMSLVALPACNIRNTLLQR